MLRMELPGKRKRGRPKRRFMDVVKENPLWRPLMGRAERRRRRRRSQEGHGGNAPQTIGECFFSINYFVTLI